MVVPLLGYCSNLLFLKSTSGIALGKMATIQWSPKNVYLEERKGLFCVYLGGFDWLGVPHPDRKCVSPEKNCILCSKKLVSGERKNTRECFSRILLDCVRPAVLCGRHPSKRSPPPRGHPAPAGQGCAAESPRTLRGQLPLGSKPGFVPRKSLQPSLSLTFSTVNAFASVTPLFPGKEVPFRAGTCFTPFCI